MFSRLDQKQLVKMLLEAGHCGKKATDSQRDVGDGNDQWQNLWVLQINETNFSVPLIQLVRQSNDKSTVCNYACHVNPEADCTSCARISSERVAKSGEPSNNPIKGSSAGSD